MNKQYVIIGASAAGISAFYTLCAYQEEPLSIICISDEAEIPYNKCFLADYIAGSKSLDALTIIRNKVVANHTIQWLLNSRVIGINAHEKLIILHDGKQINYDALLIATGSSPIIPTTIEAIQGPGVYFFHSLHNVTAMQAYIQQNKVQSALIIGGGLTGIECADALGHQGIAITLVERSPFILSHIINERGSLLVHEYLRRAGVTLHVQKQVVKIMRHDNQIKGVMLSCGTIIPAHMVICAVGVKPNVLLAQQARLMTHKAGGIIVGEYMNTSDPSIFAAGDVAMVYDQVSQQLVRSCMWPDAVQQGMIAAHAILNKTKQSYAGVIQTTTSNFFGLKIAACGMVPNNHASYDYFVIEKKDCFYAFILDSTTLKGFALIGDTSNYGLYRRLVLTKQAVDRFLLSKDI